MVCVKESGNVSLKNRFLNILKLKKVESKHMKRLF